MAESASNREVTLSAAYASSSSSAAALAVTTGEKISPVTNPKTAKTGQESATSVPKRLIEDAVARLRGFPTDEERVQQLEQYGEFKWVIANEPWPPVVSSARPQCHGDIR
jgi:4-hydroxy-3-methylbut-2-enyl diphosphate reductase IspH